MNQRSPVLLVFGRHGHGDIVPDRRFFRRAATPFLQKQTEEGRPITFILEAGAPKYDHIQPNVKKTLLHQKGRKRMENMAVLDEMVNAHRTKIVEKLNCSLREDKIHTGVPLDLWGLENEVQKINRNKTGQITLDLEPTNAGILYAGWEFNFATKEYIELRGNHLGAVIAYIRALAELTVLRDSLLAQTVSSFCVTNTTHAILILRGAKHQTMINLLDRKILDVECITSDTSSDFIEDAVTERYGGPLNERRLREYAILQLAANKFLFPQNVWSSFLATDLIIPQARQYAIAEHPEIARSLGIEK